MLEFIDTPSEGKNLWSFGILDLYFPTLKSTGGKGIFMDFLAEKGTFIVLDVVGIVGAKTVWSQIEMHVDL